MRWVPAATLAALMGEALRQRGVPEEHAAYVSDGLLEASLRGISRLARFVRDQAAASPAVLAQPPLRSGEERAG